MKHVSTRHWGEKGAGYGGLPIGHYFIASGSHCGLQSTLWSPDSGCLFSVDDFTLQYKLFGAGASFVTCFLSGTWHNSP